MNELLFVLVLASGADHFCEPSIFFFVIFVQFYLHISEYSTAGKQNISLSSFTRFLFLIHNLYACTVCVILSEVHLFIPLCSQDSVSQKSVDIQSRSEDQHSISSADRVAMENRRQSQYSSASGMGEDGSRSRTPTSKPVAED